MPPVAQSQGNLNSHRPTHTNAVDVVSEYKAIGNSHTVKRKKSKFGRDLKLQDDQLSNSSGTGLQQSFNTSKYKKAESRAFEVSSVG